MRDHARIESIRPNSTSQKALGLRRGSGAAGGRIDIRDDAPQPTPGSIASAEQDAGDLTSKEAQAITEAMDEARHADDAGDPAGCEKALSDVDRMLKR